MRDSITRLVRKHFDGVEKERIDRIVESTILFMFRGIQSHEMTRLIGKHLASASQVITGLPQRVQALKDEVSADGYLMKDLKVYLYQYAHHQYSRERGESSYRRGRGIQKRDVRLERYVHRRRVATMMEEYLDRYQPISRGKMDDMLRSITSPDGRHSLVTFSRKYVMRKMKFLTGPDMTYDDIVQDLMCKCTMSMMKMYPCIESEAHFVNLAKRCIHNHGINIISHYTTKSRRPVMQTEDGNFVRTTVSLDRMEMDPVSGGMVIEDESKSDGKGRVLVRVPNSTQEMFM